MNTRLGSDGETGSVSLYIGLLAVAFFAVTGLVSDGGRVLAARQAAAGVAASAARAGAQAVDVAAVRDHGAKVDTVAATSAARRYLGQVGALGSVNATGQTVTVTVVEVVDLPLLSMIGITHRTVRASRQAVLLRGVVDAE